MRIRRPVCSVYLFAVYSECAKGQTGPEIPHRRPHVRQRSRCLLRALQSPSGGIIRHQFVNENPPVLENAELAKPI